ncbi:hypothetical protein Z517_04493 [Fonsecaea pedrosoi CBS 271.37]|uniref:Uncharacterized protein n=1 Tax=Fonsecaea pedrosoi CBS 271.37 TaxID=1442368 RepID=A0A0D2GKS1_9EURO|nr:uncharacterized protein Z517_04493 [Fonsecaea pedrosoi CBS 271.37]KIW81468.1 hypothetical protein Z517_04493 [Fonsecaea pedrosoi CBS 271.37]
MSPFKDSKSLVTGELGNLQSVQDSAHEPSQSVKDELKHSDPPPPEILRSLSNEEFTAWGEYLEKEKPEEYISWKMRMIGESQQRSTCRFENQQASGQQGSDALSTSDPSSFVQEGVTREEQKGDETLLTMKKHDISKRKEH